MVRYFGSYEEFLWFLRVDMTSYRYLVGSTSTVLWRESTASFENFCPRRLSSTQEMNSNVYPTLRAVAVPVPVCLR